MSVYVPKHAPDTPKATPNISKGGDFPTKATAAYPPALCNALARVLLFGAAKAHSLGDKRRKAATKEGERFSQAEAVDNDEATAVEKENSEATAAPSVANVELESSKTPRPPSALSFLGI